MTRSFVITVWQYVEVLRLAYHREHPGKILIKSFSMIEDDPEFLCVEIEIPPDTPKNTLDEFYEILETPFGGS